MSILRICFFTLLFIALTLHGGAQPNPLLEAATQGSLERTRMLLAAGADVNVKDTNGDTALLLAIDRGHFDVATELLKVKGIDLNVVDGAGNTALFLAVSRQNIDLVHLLLDKGADLKATRNILMALFIVNRKVSMELMNLLLDHGADPTAGEPLMFAVRNIDPSAASQLVDRGAKLDLVDEGEKTALHWAAWYGMLDTVTRMVARGADINAKDISGQTPLMLARRANHPDVAAFLEQHGGTVNKAAELPVQKNALGQKMFRLPIPIPKSISEQEIQSLSLITGVGTDPIRVMFHLKSGKTVKSEPVSFAPVFTTDVVWDPDELNSTRYELHRGGYAADANDIYGTVLLHNTTYVGVRWYSPSASYLPQCLSCVFQVRLDKQALELTLIHKKSATTRIMLSHEMGPFSNLPILRLSKKGTLLRLDEDGKYEYNEKGTWSKVGPGPPIIDNIASDPQQYKKQESALAAWSKTDR